MTADFWKPFSFRYAPLQRLPKIIVLYFDFIFYIKWVTSIYNAEQTWNEYKKNVDTIEKLSIIKSGASHGAYTDKNDPNGEKRRASAENFYKEILNRNRDYEIQAVSKNTGFTEEDIDTVFAHIFELEHLFEDGTTKKFDPDYYMQNSWLRLRDGNNIQKHDITLLNHELAEAKIMGTGLSIAYEVAHRQVEKTYNYTKDLLEYLKDNDA